MMRVFIACEFSGIVREAFRALGHDAWSCDLLPTEIASKKHIQCDVMKCLDFMRKFDLLIAFPPCTYLCNSGVRWLYKDATRRDPYRWHQMQKAALFFKVLLETQITMIAIENPIQHSYAQHLIGRKYDQKIQPYQFGVGETKATCLWLNGLSPLNPTKIVSGRMERVHRLAPSPDRWKERSRTLPQIASAMATQWG